MRLASTVGGKSQRAVVDAVDCATLIVGFFRQQRTITVSAKLRLGIVLMLWIPLASAQSNLGELLDAGAKKLSPEEFRQELVQRLIVGPTGTGGRLELMYAESGRVSGVGNFNDAAGLLYAQITGQWTIGEGTICTSMQIGSGPGGVGSNYIGMMLPPRCQFWFKYKEQYFLSDSDSDRSARVLRRTVKQ